MNRCRIGKRGIALLEVIVYTAILIVGSTIVVASVLTLAGSYNELRSSQAMTRSALSSLERMTREIRFADTVNIAASTLGTHPGVLVLERTEDGVTDSVEFYVSDDELRIRENGVEAGALTSQKVSVSNLVFRAVVGGLTAGVKVDLSLTATSGTSTKTESFNAFAVTRKP